MPGTTLENNVRSSDIVINDANLSIAAKGAYMAVTFLGNGCQLEQIRKLSKDQEQVITEAIRELLEAGYIVDDVEGKFSVKLAPSFIDQERKP